MLKLEKVSKTLEVSITLRKKETVFNSTFLKALALALGLHLLAAILFQVSPFILRGSQIVLPPTIVDADLSDGFVIAHADSEENLPRHIKEPPGAKLPLPEMDLKSPNLEMDQNLYKNPFLSLESNLDLFEIPKMGQNLIISGPLAENPLLEEPSFNFNAKMAYRAHFAVNLDAKSGTLFWFESLQTDPDPFLELQAEKILRNLRFAPVTESLIVSGEIEITFRPHEAEG